MTSVCNVFRPIDIKTGNFLLFSQYAEDLSKSTVNDGYNVIPSRFVCLNLDSDALNTISDFNNSRSYNPETSGNAYIPQFFQNSLEECVSYAKNKNIKLAPNNFAASFWSHLGDATYNDNFSLPNYIKYDGNIDLVGWEDGFADIILNISSGSNGKQYVVNTSSDPNRDWESLPDFINDCGEYTYKPNSWIEGWSDGTPEGVVDGQLKTDSLKIGLGSYGSVQSKIDTDPTESIFDNMFVSSQSSSDSFTFNTIIILYDIKDSNGNPLYTDIPMGIYFTGDIESDIINNPVTIYKSSDDAYGAGTGWSLRICTRFSATPEGYLKVEEVATESGAIYNVISAQLGAVAELIKTTREKFNDNLRISQDLKDEVNKFTYLQKTNIPYIKDGEWFVNGTNTGYPAYAHEVDGECTTNDVLSILY